MLFHSKSYKLLLEQVEAAERSIADVVEQQRQVHEALMHQQTQHEQDIATLRETFTSQIVQIREIVDLQRSQMEQGLSYAPRTSFSGHPHFA